MQEIERIPLELRERYTALEFLGRGGQGLTFKGTRKSDELTVVLKVLDFLELNSWKDYELFLREIATLKTLKHSAIPRVLEVFPELSPGAQLDVVVLVQEYFDGQSVKEIIDASDTPWKEDEIRDFLNAMLEILAYLHSLNPPVVHRDIKPSNIIKRPDGSYALIDFGAASATQKTNASTFVGTNGYMAPEQMMGRAEPRSDLYSLGATALQLATCNHPTNLARQDFSFRLEGMGLSSFLARVLGRLANPLPEHRFRNAEQARQALNPSDALVLADVKERGMRLVRQEDDTRIDLPGPPPVQIGGLVVICILLMAVLFTGAAGMGAYIYFFGMFAMSLYVLLRKRRLYFNAETLRFEKGIGPFMRKKSWAIEDIMDVRSQKRGAFSDVIIQDKRGDQSGLGWSLKGEQAQWLVKQIKLELEERGA